MIKTKILNKYTLNFTSDIILLNDLYHISALLTEFQKDYPNIDKWFLCKVYRGIFSGQRTILLKKRNNQILGLSILKHTDEERKLCTLFVDKNFHGKGLGTELMEESLEILKCGHPIFTVSANRISEFQSLIKKFNFSLYKLYPDYYRKGLTEYAFNGGLTVNKKISSNNWVHLTAIPLRPSAALHVGR